VTLGRGAENTVVLALPQVSRNHLRIESRGSYWLVHDQSTNGTLLREEGAQPLMLRRDQSRLAGKGMLELAPSNSNDGEACVRYEIF
jgi:pSer/pThr/pTyr-binding forkhead associated (FHA) protein